MQPLKIKNYHLTLGIDTRPDQIFTCWICKKRRYPVRESYNEITSIDDPVIAQWCSLCFFCIYQEATWGLKINIIAFPCGMCWFFDTKKGMSVYSRCYNCSEYEGRLFNQAEKEQHINTVLDTKHRFLPIMNEDQIKLRCLVIWLHGQSDQMKRLPKDVLKYLCRLEFPILCEN
jgi:hypothetical protein